MDRPLGRERRELIGGEALGTGVRQQPIETTGKVGQMESNRGGASRPGPEMCGRQVLNDWYYILSDLQDGVGGGLQERLDAVDRTTEPGFGGQCHGGKLVKRRENVGPLDQA